MHTSSFTSSFALARLMQSSAFSDPRASGRVQYAEVTSTAGILLSKVALDVHPRVKGFLPADIHRGVSLEDFLASGRLTTGPRRLVNRGLPAPDYSAWEAFRARHGLGARRAA